MRGLLTIVSVAVALGRVLAVADTVRLGAVQDNTLYFSLFGETSNGAGHYFFAGTTNQHEPRRGLIQFNVAGTVPPGSRITAVTLTLHMSRTISGPSDVSLHRVRSAWGEAGSDAAGEEGAGAPAEPGDATWLHAFYPDQDWPNGAGGDFVPTASAVTSVNSIGYYTWSGAGLVADVQAWVDAPTSEFGWQLNGDERFAPSAKRFDTRENPVAEFRPVLEVQYVPEPSALLALAIAAPLLLRVGAGGESAAWRS